MTYDEIYRWCRTLNATLTSDQADEVARKFATQAGALQVVGHLQVRNLVAEDNVIVPNVDIREFARAVLALAAAQPNAAPAAEVVALRTLLTGEQFRLSPEGRVLWRDKGGGSTLPDGCNGRWIPLDLNTLVYRVSAPAAAIDAREQEAPTFSCHLARDQGCAPCASDCGKLRCMYPSAPSAALGPELVTVGAMHKCRTDAQFDQCVNCGAMAEELAKPCKSFLTEAATNSTALTSRSEAPSARPNAAGQERGWQDIATAPKDRSELLLLCQRCGSAANGYWLAEAYAGNGAWVWPYVHKTPTHWMPLPPLEAVGSSGMTADKAQGDKT